MQPGAERAPAIEAVERPDRREERFLGDVLGGRRVADDQVGGPVRAPPVPSIELLERLGRASLGVSHQRPVAPCAGKAHSHEAGQRLAGSSTHCHPALSRDCAAPQPSARSSSRPGSPKIAWPWRSEPTGPVGQLDHERAVPAKRWFCQLGAVPWSQGRRANGSPASRAYARAAGTLGPQARTRRSDCW